MFDFAGKVFSVENFFNVVMKLVYSVAGVPWS